MKKIIAVLLAAIMLLGLWGCGSKSDYATDIYYPTAEAAAPNYKYEYGDDLNFSPAESVSGGSNDVTTAASVDPSDKLIYRADLTISTTNFDAALRSLDNMVIELGGFVESSNVSNGNINYYYDGPQRTTLRTANYVLRVPCDRFREAVNRTGELGIVQSSSTNVENITPQFVDQTARKHTLEVQEQRLLEMLKKADDVLEMIELEDRLADVRYQIESIESTLRDWQNQVDYSTVYVYLREVEAYSPDVTGQQSFGDELGDALGDGWDGFLYGLRGFVIFLARYLPAVIIFVVIAVVVLVIVVRHHKKKKAMIQRMYQPMPPVQPVPPVQPMQPTQPMSGDAPTDGGNNI